MRERIESRYSAKSCLRVTLRPHTESNRVPLITKQVRHHLRFEGLSTGEAIRVLAAATMVRALTPFLWPRLELNKCEQFPPAFRVKLFRYVDGRSHKSASCRDYGESTYTIPVAPAGVEQM